MLEWYCYSFQPFNVQEAKKWLRVFFKDVSLKVIFILFLFVFFSLHLAIINFCIV